MIVAWFTLRCTEVEFTTNHNKLVGRSIRSKPVNRKIYSKRIVTIASVVSMMLTLAVGPIFAGQASAVSPTKRTIYMIAFEPKGSTTIDKEPFPTEALPNGGGYKLIPPDENGKWTVETYRWMPSVVVVNQGDEITLEILGVNGKIHKGAIEEYVASFDVERGKITTLNFVAGKAGTFRILCVNHKPAMEGYLLVLPRKQQK